MNHQIYLAIAVVCLAVLTGCNAPPLAGVGNSDRTTAEDIKFPRHSDNGGFAREPTAMPATEVVLPPGMPTPVVPVPTRIPQTKEQPQVQQPVKPQNSAPVVNSNPTTPIPPTAPNAAPEIQLYEVSKYLAYPGETITVKWKTTAKRVSFIMENFDGTQALGAWYDLPAGGSTQITIPETAAIYIKLSLVASNDVSVDQNNVLTFKIDLHCTAQWFFANAPEGCPTVAYSYEGVAQQFERGFMIWRPHESGWASHILIFNNDGSFRSIDDGWKPGMPESDPALVPPSGLYQPVRGFGKVWREGNYMSSLGWALGPEFVFDGISQKKIVPSTEWTPSYEMTPNDVLQLDYQYLRWKLWDTGL